MTTKGTERVNVLLDNALAAWALYDTRRMMRPNATPDPDYDEFASIVPILGEVLEAARLFRGNVPDSAIEEAREIWLNTNTGAALRTGAALDAAYAKLEDAHEHVES